MIILFIVIVFVTAILGLQYMFYKHLVSLEILLRVDNVNEYPNLVNQVQSKKTKEEVIEQGPENLQDLISGNSAENIRQSFRKSD